MSAADWLRTLAACNESVTADYLKLIKETKYVKKNIVYTWTILFTVISKFFVFHNKSGSFFFVFGASTEKRRYLVSTSILCERLFSKTEGGESNLRKILSKLWKIIRKFLLNCEFFLRKFVKYFYVISQKLLYITHKQYYLKSCPCSPCWYTNMRNFYFSSFLTAYWTQRVTGHPLQ